MKAIGLLLTLATCAMVCLLVSGQHHREASWTPYRAPATADCSYKVPSTQYVAHVENGGHAYIGTGSVADGADSPVSNYVCENGVLYDPVAKKVWNS